MTVLTEVTTSEWHSCSNCNGKGIIRHELTERQLDEVASLVARLASQTTEYRSHYQLLCQRIASINLRLLWRKRMLRAWRGIKP